MRIETPICLCGGGEKKEAPDASTPGAVRNTPKTIGTRSIPMHIVPQAYSCLSSDDTRLDIADPVRQGQAKNPPATASLHKCASDDNNVSADPGIPANTVLPVLPTLPPPCDVIISHDDGVRPAHSNIPFAGVVDKMLALLEHRNFSPVFSCSKCRATWSASLSLRAARPQTWWACPNGCDCLGENRDA